MAHERGHTFMRVFVSHWVSIGYLEENLPRRDAMLNGCHSQQIAVFISLQHEKNNNNKNADAHFLAHMQHLHPHFVVFSRTVCGYVCFCLGENEQSISSFSSDRQKRGRKFVLNLYLHGDILGLFVKESIRVWRRQFARGHWAIFVGVFPEMSHKPAQPRAHTTKVPDWQMGVIWSQIDRKLWAQGDILNSRPLTQARRLEYRI